MDTIADRVDLVKRASEATIEITRQLGAALVAARCEVRLARIELDQVKREATALRAELAAHKFPQTVLPFIVLEAP